MDGHPSTSPASLRGERRTTPAGGEGLLDSHPPRTTVLYIAGFGRSGSTLLERIVDQLPGFVSVGELIFLFERGLVGHGRCGCGCRVEECRFWTAVGERAFGGWGKVDVEHVLRLQRTVQRHGHLLGRVDPRLAPRFRAAFEEYTSGYLVPVYAAVAEVAGADVVVDSSKRVSWAFLLRHVRGVDLRVAHAVRHPQGVAFSWGRPPSAPGGDASMPRYSPAVATAWWLYANTSLRMLPLTRVPTQVVRYEELVEDPATVARRLGALTGREVQEASLAFIERDRVHLTPGHSVAGNPMRFQAGSVPIRADDAWRRQGRRRDRVAVNAIAALCPSPAVRYPLRHRPSDGSSPVAVAPPRQPSAWPSVSAVITTRDRPALVRRAIASVLAQDYPGDLEVVVVFDQCAVDHQVVVESGLRRVRVLPNGRRAGLPGARNTGVAAAEGTLIALCDDDDEWLAGRLREQVELLCANPWAVVASSGMVVDYDGTLSVRRPDRQVVTHADLLRSRVAWLHSSTLLVWRRAYTDEIGWVDEDVPGGFGEDYDWLLRAAHVAPIVVSRRCLTRVTWGSQSYFASQWEAKTFALRWLVDRHPDLWRVPAGRARILGQIAFGEAAGGRRFRACRTAAQALRANPAEPRALLALAVASGAVHPDRIVSTLHRRGRGV